MEDCYPIVLCFDEWYAPYAAVTTHSIWSKSEKSTKFYWIYDLSLHRRISKLADKLRSVGIEIDSIGVDIGIFSEWKSFVHISQATYFKLLIPSVIPVNRALYVDCDVIAVSDVRPAFSIELGNNLIGAVADPLGGETSRVPRSPEDPYVNSGVMLMNLSSFRQRDFLAEGIALYDRYKNEIVWMDQCIFNKFSEGRKKIIDPAFNVCLRIKETSAEEFEVLKNPNNSTLLHFFGTEKPWDKSCPPHFAEFWEKSTSDPVLKYALRRWFGPEYQIRLLNRKVRGRLKRLFASAR